MRYQFKAFGGRSDQQLADMFGPPGADICLSWDDGRDPYSWTLVGAVTADNPDDATDKVHQLLENQTLLGELDELVVIRPCQVCGFDQGMHEPPQSMGHGFVDQLNPAEPVI